MAPMPWLVVGLFLLLLGHAAFAPKAPTAASLDPNLPPLVAQAVVRAWTVETNAAMRAQFAKVLAASGYPKAAAVLASR